MEYGHWLGGLSAGKYAKECKDYRKHDDIGATEEQEEDLMGRKAGDRTVNQATKS